MPSGGFFYQGPTSVRVVKLALLTKKTKHRIIFCNHSQISSLPALATYPALNLGEQAEVTTIVTALPGGDISKELGEQISAFQEVADYSQRKIPKEFNENKLKLVLLEKGTRRVVDIYPK